MKRHFLSAPVLLLAANLSAHDTGLSIGVNFGANDNGTTVGRALAPTERAGAVPQFNWNNANDPSGGAASLIQDLSGAAQAGAVSVSWSCPNTWSSSGRGEENNGFPAGGDRVLMTGYLDTTDNSAGVATVTVNGLGPDFTVRGYDVLVYCAGGVSGRGGAYTIGPMTKFGTAPDNPGAHVEDAGVDLSDAGTYVRFSGLRDASFTLTASSDGAVYPGHVNFRAPINALQIVAAPESDFNDWFALSSGGGHGGGGDFELLSTIGQSLAGGTSGGDYGLVVGFGSILPALNAGAPPVIQCPTNFIVTLPCGSNCVAVSYSLPTVLTGALVGCTPPPGTCLPAGIHPILCRGTNQSTEAECVFTVQVVPEPIQPPVIQCPTNFIVTLPCGSNCVAVSYPPPTILNGALVSCTLASGTCLPAGVHPILCRAANPCSEAECVFTVQVVPEPAQPPVIQCPTNLIVTLPCNSNCVAITYPPPTVLNGALVGCTPPPGTCLPAGVHPVLCRASNPCAEAECVFTVQVVPEPIQPPVLRATLAGPSSVLISWPAPSTCWVLEQSSALGPSAHWTEVSAPVIQNGSNNTVTQSSVTGSRFYRLTHP